jgi:hypothetical protein
MYVDGVYIASPSASLLSLNNIAQVETHGVHRERCSGATPGGALLETREPRKI